jgi:hypothetical protein
LNSENEVRAPNLVLQARKMGFLSTGLKGKCGVISVRRKRRGISNKGTEHILEIRRILYVCKIAKYSMWLMK